MARFGRTSPPSTRLRKPVQPDGPPPHVYELAVAGEQTTARPVNRAVGEARTAREQVTALAVGRAHARTPGVPVEQDTARAFAGRTHRRDLGRAGETTTAVAVRRAHRRDVARTSEYSSARSILGDRPNVSPEAWAAAIESEDRTPVLKLTADWGRTGQYDHQLSDLTPLVKSVTADRSVSTSLPANVGIVEGSAAASMSVDLGGEWPDAEGITPTVAFAPYRPDAPFYRKPIIGTPVALDTGFVTEEGEKTQRQFTGSIRKIATKSKDRKVTLDALDGANELRAPISLGANGLDALLLKRYGVDRYFQRINSQWLIDYILRRNGVYASPPPTSSAVLSATMHGSSIPEIGIGGMPQGYTSGSAVTKIAWRNDDHPFGMLYPNQTAPITKGDWTAAGPLPIIPGSGVGASGWFYFDPAKAIQTVFIKLGADNTGTLLIETNNGRPAATLFLPTIVGSWSHQFPAVATAQWLYFGVHVAVNQSTVLVSLRWQNTNGYVTANRPVGEVKWPPNPTVSFQTGVGYGSFTNLQVWSAPNRPADTAWPGEQWNSQATIDPGVGEWLGIPAISGEDSWALLTEIVAAEFGACGFDTSGNFFFRSQLSGTSNNIDRQTVSASKSLADLATTTDESAVRNVVTGQAQSYLVGDWETVYEPSDPAELDCGPGITDFYLPLAEGTVQVWSPTTGRFLYSSADTFESDVKRFDQRADIIFYRVASANPSQPLLNGGVSVAAVLLPGPTLRLTINNETSNSIRFAQVSTTDSDGNVQDGRPAFRFPGRRLLLQPATSTVISDTGSIQDYGERSYDLGGQSRWRQHLPAVAATASSVLAALGRPAPVLENVDVPHDPRRQLFDPIAVADPDGLGTVLGTTTGIRTVYSSGGAKDSLTVRPIGAPGLGVLDDADLGRVGDSLVLGT